MAQGDILADRGQIDIYPASGSISYDDFVVGVVHSNNTGNTLYGYEVELFNINTMEFEMGYDFHNNDVYDICFHPTKSEMATIGNTHLIISNYETGEIIQNIHLSDYELHGNLDINNAGDEITVTAWEKVDTFTDYYYTWKIDYNTGDILNEYEYGDSGRIKYSSDDSMIALIGNTITIKDVVTNDIILEVSKDDIVNGIVFIEDDNHIVYAGFYNQPITKIEISTGNIVNSVDNQTFGSSEFTRVRGDIDYNPNNNTIAIPFDDNVNSVILNGNDLSLNYKQEISDYYGNYIALLSNSKDKVITNYRDGDYYLCVWESGYVPPIDVTLTMPGYYSSSIMTGDISKESTTEMKGYYSSPIVFDMVRIADIFREFLDINLNITTRAESNELEITRVTDSKNSRN